MRVFLTGATGFVGSHLLQRLLNENHTVRALVRDIQRASSIKNDKVEFIQGDVTQGTGLDAGMKDCDAVIHLVGIIIESPSATFETIHHIGTRNVAEAAKRNQVSRFIQMS